MPRRRPLPPLPLLLLLLVGCVRTVAAVATRAAAALPPSDRRLMSRRALGRPAAPWTPPSLLETREGEPPMTPVSVDVVTCSIEDCSLMCICQKLLWIIDYNHPMASEPTDQICLKWADEKHMASDGAKAEECLTGCLVIAQFIDGAAGRDPYICQRARDAVQHMGNLAKSSRL